LTWKLLGEKLPAYSISIDTHDSVWLTDFSANAIGRFDPQNAWFERFPSARLNANIRPMLGRREEVWMVLPMPLGPRAIPAPQANASQIPA
jgi:virginiamycin B lyase